MTVVGNRIVFDRQENIFSIHLQLESVGFEIGHHYTWCWHGDQYAAQFCDLKDIVSFLIQRGHYGKT